MSLNTVPINDNNEPVLNNHEKIHFCQPASLDFQAGSGFPGSNSLCLQGQTKVYLTNHRVIIIPDKPNRLFMSFEIPLLHLTQTSVQTSMFGYRSVKGLVKPVGDSIPEDGCLTLGLSSGAFEFKTFFDELQLKSDQVHVEPLPEYEEAAPEYS